MNPFKIFLATLKTRGTNEPLDLTSLYNIQIKSLKNKPLTLENFKGKHILFVNVASKCGFTPQYKDLQLLQDTYRKTLEVIGVPCNQFGAQEPGTAKDIESFCEINYNVDFLLTEKINVKGKNQHPLYKWLTNKAQNGVSSSTVKWNFQKYLINEKGELLDYFYSATNPMSEKITKYLK